MEVEETLAKMYWATIGLVELFMYVLIMAHFIGSFLSYTLKAKKKKSIWLHLAPLYNEVLSFRFHPVIKAGLVILFIMMLKGIE